MGDSTGLQVSDLSCPPCAHLFVGYAVNKKKKKLFLPLLMGDSPLLFLLRDDFTDTRAVGEVNGTPAVPGGIGTTAQKTRLVLESLGSCRVQGGMGEAATAGGNTNYSDPLLCYGAFSRLAGRFCIFRIRTDAGSKYGGAGWSAAQSNFDANGTVGAVSFRAGSVVQAHQGVGLGGVGATLFSYTADTDYDFAIVLRSAGAYIFFKSASYWALGWFGSSGSGTSLYPVAFGTYNALLKTSFMRVPQALWLPTPLAYDTFSRADGAPGSTETTGPDGQAAPARSHLGGSSWQIAANAAVNSPPSGSDIIVNGGFDTDTDWTKDANWSISGGAAASNGSSGNLYENAASAGLWYKVMFDLKSRTAGTVKPLFGNGTFYVNSYSSPADNITTTGLVVGNTRIGMNSAAFNGTIDNVRAYPLSASDLMNLIDVGVKDFLFEAKITTAHGRQCGIVLRADSASNPMNFILAVFTGANLGAGATVIHIYKCVGGTYTLLGSITNATYAAGGALRGIVDGTALQVYYNNNLLLSTTVSDAGIVNNTMAGVFASDSFGLSVDDILAFPRGSNGEYSHFNKYIGGDV